ncbi:hypothetical protein HALA3H3_210045 [Halomonas sp. A3H3]|nr:conserved hypothetical protein [Halomonas sp. I3]CAD5272578.1 conserved hypothetical protein [Halomonas sp. 113]CAD5274355.1 conserved hypothetical protein [Halomonas sp. 59]CDG51512.1 hypothetical protein HALA3H3_210045 [Halomonas sp. A3H3]VXB88485.1 conserved hypothetical protein [Halomonas titanicae]
MSSFDKQKSIYLTKKASIQLKVAKRLRPNTQSIIFSYSLSAIVAINLKGYL